MKHLDKYEPKVIAFNLEEGILELLPEVLQNKDSNVFIKKWTSTGNQECNKKGEMLSIKEILKDVWHPLQIWWTELCQKMENGTIFFKVYGN